MKWIWWFAINLSIIGFFWKFVSLANLAPPVCYKKYGGICIENSHKCPFVNATKKENAKNRLCPEKMYCCIAPQSNDRFSYSKKTPNCGNLPRKKGIMMPVILGGYKASKSEFPWQVSISCFDAHDCGGVLIHPQWVLTAAHCKTNSRCDPEDFVITIGKVNLNSPTGKENQERTVKNYIIHPDFNDDQNDIALIELDKPVELNNFVNTVCLPNPKESFNDMTCVASGFGVTENAGEASDHLMFLPLPIVSHGECEKFYKNEFNKAMNYNSQLCAGFNAGKRDTCRGDSGGPLVCRKQDENSNWRYVLAGVTSFGAQICGKEEAFGVYTRSSNFITWINTVTAIPFF